MEVLRIRIQRIIEDNSKEKNYKDKQVKKSPKPPNLGISEGEFVSGLAVLSWEENTQKPWADTAAWSVQAQ